MKSNRDRGHGLLRPRGRVLRVRRGALRADAALGLLPHRLRRGAVEHRARRAPEPRLQAPLQGGTSRRRRRTASSICARRWCSSSRSSASRWRCSTTRWRPPASARSACGRSRSSTWADSLMWFKYVVKNVCRRNKAHRDLYAQADLSGQRLGHARALSLWKDGNTLFAGNRYAGLSEAGGCSSSAASSSTRRRSARSPTPAPTAYRRLVPGFEAPINLAYSSRNRSAAVRIPMYSPSAEEQAHRVPHPRSVVQTPTSPSRRC